MFAKLALFSSLAILAVATPTPGVNDPPASQCNTGPVQCCQNTATAGSVAGAAALASVGAIVQDINVLLGLTCSPISVVGVGSGATCNSSPVCCTNNNFHGVVAIGCVPVNINL